jgi:hypothetical protein
MPASRKPRIAVRNGVPATHVSGFNCRDLRGDLQIGHAVMLVGRLDQVVVFGPRERCIEGLLAELPGRVGRGQQRDALPAAAVQIAYARPDERCEVGAGRKRERTGRGVDAGRDAVFDRTRRVGGGERAAGCGERRAQHGGYLRRR